MESEDCTFLAQPKYKQHKVSAFRDFPEGCGPYASRVVDPGTTLDEKVARTVDAVKYGQDGAAKAVTRKSKYSFCRRVSAVRDFPPLCRKIASCLGEGESIKGVYTLKKQVEKNVEDGYAYDGMLLDKVQGDSEGNIVGKEKPDMFGKCFTIPKESYHHDGVMNSKTVVDEGNGDGTQFAGASGQEVIVYQEVQDLGTKPLDMFDSQHELKGRFDGLQVAPCRTVVLGLMSESGCPRRSGGKRKGKRVYFRSNADINTNHSKKPSQKKKGNAACESAEKLIINEKEDSLYPSDSNVTRNKVRETLRLFQVVSRKLSRDEESKLQEQASSRRRVDLQAAKILEKKGKYLNTSKILGPVPGVDVGDEFQYRVELNIVGLHQQIQGDIDYVKQNGKILATSVVVLRGYADELDDSDALIYTGSSGNVMNTDKELEDQKLEPENLALKNSIEEKNPVRVIWCSESMDGKCQTYIYDGQYVVETCWQVIEPHGKLVSRFRLRRIPDQLELSWNEVKKSKQFKTRDGLCVDDISHGKELIPVCAVNTIDDQTTPLFEYVTGMIYPNWCNPIPPGGCNCANECSSSKKCSCAVKNGGVIPFNHDGAIVEGKPLVYECGPSCKCPPTCYNRVSQHGIKFQLEIFKTKSRGWGVRSLNSIPSGSFICEYVGELLGEDEAEERVGNDEYLFDIGNNYSNHSLWDGLSTVMPDAPLTSCEVVEDSSFTIDAAHYGNVGRFINHSCSPNLYAQNVLYDHDDKRIPHIMLFAVENIPPLQELTYDYNYKIDQVFGSDGNIKKKNCYCGSVECTGRMY